MARKKQALEKTDRSTNLHTEQARKAGKFVAFAEEQNSQNLTVRIKPSQYKKLRTIAGDNLSDLVREIIDDYLKKIGK